MKHALLVAKIGPARDGLQSLLTSIDDVELVAVTETMRAALAYSADSCPDIIVVGQNVMNDRSAVRFGKLRAQCKQTPILILGDSAESVPEMPKGVFNIVPQTGVQSADIAQTIEALLQPQQRAP